MRQRLDPFCGFAAMPRTIARMAHRMPSSVYLSRQLRLGARFGAECPGISSPLEGTSRIVRAGAGMFHYYIKLVRIGMAVGRVQ